MALALAHADAVADEEPREVLAVDQHDALLHLAEEVARLARKRGGGDKDALGRALARQRADELLDRGARPTLLPGA